MRIGEVRPAQGPGSQNDVKVVMNQAGQLGLWPVRRSNPRGWEDTGTQGTREECLAYIERYWVDLRPKASQEHLIL